MHVADRLCASMDRTGSIACVGLDPRPALLPDEVRAAARRAVADPEQAVAAAFTAFNERIIAAVAGHCAAVKPQVACYEAYGPPGWQALRATVRAAREAGVPVVVDAKRNDIGSTAEHYRQAFFGGAPDLDGAPVAGAGADWLTVNPYLGHDGVGALLTPEAGAHGVFVLVQTSNPSSGEIQGRRVVPEPPPADAGPETVAETVARLVQRWGEGRTGRSGLSDVGAVVGATYPDQARALRERMPDAVFLVPGYGAQGGSAGDALAGVRSDGRGVLVSSSRQIIGAWQDAPPNTDWADAARGALDAMNEALAEART